MFNHRNTQSILRIEHLVPTKDLSPRRVFNTASYNHVGFYQYRMTQVFGAGQYTRHQHQNDIRDLIVCVFTSFYSNMLIQHFNKIEFLSKSTEVNKTSMACKIFFRKLGVKSTHHFSASFNRVG